MADTGDTVSVTVKVTVNRAAWAAEYGLANTDSAVREDVLSYLTQLSGNEPALIVTKAR
jgi:hypothetical protein